MFAVSGHIRRQIGIRICRRIVNEVIYPSDSDIFHVVGGARHRTRHVAVGNIAESRSVLYSVQEQFVVFADFGHQSFVFRHLVHLIGIPAARIGRSAGYGIVPAGHAFQFSVMRPGQ